MDRIRHIPDICIKICGGSAELVAGIPSHSRSNLLRDETEAQRLAAEVRLSLFFLKAK
jgi:hypothetical protein